jgi:hypothetical protein
MDRNINLDVMDLDETGSGSYLMDLILSALNVQVVFVTTSLGEPFLKRW